MGRTLKRVPLDFDAPLKKIWKGYENPYPLSEHKCSLCDGDGYSAAARRAKDRWYGYVPFCPEDNGSVPFAVDHPVIIEHATCNVDRSPSFYPGYTREMKIELECERLAKHFNKSWSHHLNKADVDALLADDRLWDLTKTWTGKEWVIKDPVYIPTPDEVNAWSLMGIGHDSINCHVVVADWCKRNGLSHNCSACGGDGWGSKKAKVAHDDWEREEPPEGEGYQLWETTSEGSPISPVFETLEALCE